MFPSCTYGLVLCYHSKWNTQELHKDSSRITRSLVVQNPNYLTYVQGGRAANLAEIFRKIKLNIETKVVFTIINTSISFVQIYNSGFSSKFSGCSLYGDYNTLK
jgi:hypothetical protein